MTAEDLLAAQRLVRRAPIGERIVEAILDLVRAARPGEGDPELTKGIGWGPGPRAAQALMLAARARALVDGRLSPSLEDVAALAEPALKHRMALTFAARAEGETTPDGDRAPRREASPMTERHRRRTPPAGARHPDPPIDRPRLDPTRPKPAAMTISPSIRQDAATLSARLPSLVIAARKIAQTVRHGVHGRRRAGSGETFWQFRPFISGEPSSRVDWRRSAREEHAFVRETRMGSRAHGLDLVRPVGVDALRIEPRRRRRRSTARRCSRSLSPIFACAAASAPALLGLTRPLATQGVVERFAEAIATDERLHGASEAGLPPLAPAPSRSMALLVGDFLGEPDETERAMRAISAEGAVGELVLIVDPIEETYPFSGNVEFLHPAGGAAAREPEGAEPARGLSRAGSRRIARR